MTLPQHDKRESLGYRPALDGLRALAVAAVLLYHHGASFAPGGFLGVDVFFVLSGFLITTLLLQEHRGDGRVDVRAFWRRRVRRLLPALLLLLAGVAVYAAFVAQPAERASLRLDGFATLFYVENWRLVFTHHSYFDLFNAPSPLRHAWSLSIEEQWYVVWPLALWGLLRVTRGRTTRMVAVVGGLAVASAVWMAVLYHPGQDPSRVYYGTDTRAQALLVGSALALVLFARRPIRSVAVRAGVEGFGIAALVLSVWMVGRVGDASSVLYRGGFFAAAIAFTFVITAALQPGSLVVGRVLSVEPLRLLGLISYGVYLFHWPIFLWLSPTRTGLEGNRLLLVRVAVTLVVAIASYRLVEMPIRKGRLGSISLRRLVPVGVAIAAVALVLGTLGGAVRAPVSDSAFGLPDSPPTTAAPAPAPGAPTPSGTKSAPARRLAPAVPGAAPPAPGTPAPASTDLKVLVAGDSQAWRLGYTTNYLPTNIYQVTVALLGCGISDGVPMMGSHPIPPKPECATWESRYLKASSFMHPDLSVLLVGGWEVFDQEVDGRRMRTGTTQYRDYLLGQLDRARVALTAGGSHFVILGTPCFDRPVYSANDLAAVQNDEDRVSWVDSVQRSYVAAHAGSVSYVDLGPLLCPGGKPRDTIDGTLVRDDGMHFTEPGARLVWSWLAPQLHALARQYPVARTTSVRTVPTPELNRPGRVS